MPEILYHLISYFILHFISLSLLISSPWVSVTAHVGMIQSCARGGSDSILKEWLYQEDGHTLEERWAAFPKPVTV